jgi:hypothetical protein
LVLSGEFKRGMKGKNGQLTRKGGFEISGQCIDDYVATAPE